MHHGINTISFGPFHCSPIQRMLKAGVRMLPLVIQSYSCVKHAETKSKEYLPGELKWSLGADRLIAAGAYPGFCSMKRLGVFLLPLEGMLVYRRSLPRNLLGFPNNSLVPIYTPGWREALWELSVLPKNTTQCHWPRLEPGPLNPGTSALTMRPPRLPPN